MVAISSFSFLIIILVAIISLQADSILLFLNIIISIIDILKQLVFIYNNIHQILKLIIINLIKFLFRIYLLLFVHYIIQQIWPHQHPQNQINQHLLH